MATKLNDFATDLEYSLDEDDNELLDRFYYRIFPGLASIEFVKNLRDQKRGVDKILYFQNGGTVTIDEKKRRKDYGDIALEIYHKGKDRRLGWFFTAQCDYIVYIVMPTRKIYLLPLLSLRMAWRKNREKWLKYKRIISHNKNYDTFSIPVPPQELLDAIGSEISQELGTKTEREGR